MLTVQEASDEISFNPRGGSGSPLVEFAPSEILVSSLRRFGNVMKLTLHGQGIVDGFEKQGKVRFRERADERYDRTEEESTSDTSDDMVVGLNCGG